MKRLCWRLSHFGLPSDLRGKRVLDIGAWDGWFSFECERRGSRCRRLRRAQYVSRCPRFARFARGIPYARRQRAIGGEAWPLRFRSVFRSAVPSAPPLLGLEKVVELCRSAGFALAELKDVTNQRASVVCRRRWPEPNGVGAAPHFNAAINNRTQIARFHPLKDEYLCCALIFSALAGRPGSLVAAPLLCGAGGSACRPASGRFFS